MVRRSNAVALRREMESLLAEGVDGAHEREHSYFDRYAEPFDKAVVLYGAGGLGRRTLSGLRKHGVEPVAFADGNPKVSGRKHLPVFQSCHRKTRLSAMAGVLCSSSRSGVR